MAFTSGFQYDIFISYARDNNHGGDSGWVTRFHKRLENELKEITSRELRIWRDEERVDRNEEFEKKIRASVENSAIFLAVNSLAYWQSDYCKNEVGWFVSRTAADGIGPAVYGRKRIFNVRYNNVQKSEWPESFQEAQGSQFHKKPVEDEVALALRPDSTEFEGEFEKLLQALRHTLEEIKARIGTVSEGAETPRPFTVFLAETSEELRNRLRKRVAIELQNNGLHVINGAPLLNSVEHDKQAVRLI